MAPKHPKILIADDDSKARIPLTAILESEGYTVEAVDDGQKALDLLADGSFGLVLADLKMPKVNGIELLQAMRERGIGTEFVMITGEGGTDVAIQAMRDGAADYIEKPLNAERLSKLKAQIPRLLEGFALQAKNRELETKLEGLTHYGALIGQSEGMRAVYDMIDRVAPSLASVLILGESGTGKELVADAIHKKSDRAKGPFYALNCAALPKEILENLLFGHEKGAFTGSTNEKAGAFEEASGGTIFLDEVAEMAPDIQVKLLRSLETRTVRRLGGKREIPVDIRIVAATNKDLQKAISENELREDLYYRLAVVEVDLPPLRDRGSDVQLIAREFLARFARDNGKKVDGFDDAAMQWINAYYVAGQRSRAAQRGREGCHPRARRQGHARRHHVAPPPGVHRRGERPDHGARRVDARGSAEAPRAAQLRGERRRPGPDGEDERYDRRRRARGAARDDRATHRRLRPTRPRRSTLPDATAADGAAPPASRDASPSDQPPPVVLPPNVASPVGKPSKSPATARRDESRAESRRAEGCRARHMLGIFAREVIRGSS